MASREDNLPSRGAVESRDEMRELPWKRPDHRRTRSTHEERGSGKGQKRGSDRGLLEETTAIVYKGDVWVPEKA